MARMETGTSDEDREEGQIPARGETIGGEGVSGVAGEGDRGSEGLDSSLPVGRRVDVGPRLQDLPGQEPLDDDRMERFAHLCVTHTQSEAYRLVYPERAKKWALRTIWRESSELARDERVTTRVVFLRALHAARFEAHGDNVVQEIARVAFCELPGIIDIRDGKLIINDFDGLSPEQRRGIKKMRIFSVGRDEGGREVTCCEVEMHDKLKALEMLGRLNGQFDAGKDHLGKQTLNVHFDFTGQRPAPPTIEAPPEKPENAAILRETRPAAIEER